MTTYSFTREIPLRHNVDIFITGGGPAGVAAAVSAASYRHDRPTNPPESDGAFLPNAS